MENLKFSVSMCVYKGDNPKWFKTAVDSILNQSVVPNEVVIVVDGPVTDDLNKIINEYEKKPIFKVVRIKENVGHGNARRIGLENCSNEYVALMDADDISHPQRFEKQIAKFLEEPSLDIVGANITEFIGEPENIVGKRIVPQTDEEIKKYLKYRCPFNQMTVIFKKNSVNSVGGYIDWYCDEDYYLWIRMYLANMYFTNCSENLVNVRVGEDMYNRRGGFKYFKSEARLQKYMLKNNIIRFGTYLSNVTKRFIVQVLLPNKIRGLVFKKFAREK